MVDTQAAVQQKIVLLAELLDNIHPNSNSSPNIHNVDASQQLVNAKNRWQRELALNEAELPYVEMCFLVTLRTLKLFRQIRSTLVHGNPSFFEKLGLINTATSTSRKLAKLNRDIGSSKWKIDYSNFQKAMCFQEAELAYIPLTTTWNSLMILTNDMPFAIKKAREGDLDVLLRRFAQPFSLSEVNMQSIDRFYRTSRFPEKKIRLVTAFSSGALIAGLIADLLEKNGYQTEIEILALNPDAKRLAEDNFPLMTFQTQTASIFPGFTIVIDDNLQSGETAEALQRHARETSTSISET